MNTDYYRQRRTLDEPVEISGHGLHTNSESTIRLRPAESGSGITFVRTDLDPSVSFSAHVSRISDTPRSTVIESDGETLHTIEHLLASLYGLGVTDLTIEVDGPEIPIMDGSAATFVSEIQHAGLSEHTETRKIFQVDEAIHVNRSGQSIVLLPATEATISMTISYDNPGVGDQFIEYALDPESFATEIAPARTYGFTNEIEELYEKDLARGGSLDNALIVDDDGNFVGDDPQFEDEFVRHKVLDLIGDMALTGQFIVGRFIGIKTSHDLHVTLAGRIDEQVSNRPIESGDQISSDDTRTESLDIEDIKDILPHRYPMLLVDRIVSIDFEDTKAVGYKNVTFNEEFFSGHFPDDPVMPGVLIMEAMAQLGAACVLQKPEYENKNSYFMGLDNVKWRKPVRPGDRLYFEITGDRMKSRYGVVDGKAFVDGELAAEGKIKFAIVDT